MEKKYSLTDYSLLLLLAAVFASNFVMTKITVQVLPPFFVVSFRLFIAASVLYLIMVWAGKSFPKPGKIWLLIIASAFFGYTLPFSLISWAQQGVDAGFAAILMATMPLFVLLLAQVFTNDEKPNRYSVAGFSIALIGILILFGFDKLTSLADQSIRQYVIILAAMSYGVNVILTKHFSKMAWQQSTCSLVVAAFVLSLPALLFCDLSHLNASLKVWSAAVYTGLFPTAFGALMVVIVIQRTSASFLSQINFLIPLFGVGFSILFLGEELPKNGFIALLIILMGVALARRRPKRTIISINKGV